MQRHTHAVVALVKESAEVVDLVTAALAPQSHTSVCNMSLEEAATGASLVLYDAVEDGEYGRDHIAAHTRRSPTPIAVFTGALNVDSALEYFRAGSLGYLSKLAPVTQLAASLDHLLAGHATLDPTLAGALAQTSASTPRTTWPGISDGLTRREGEVLQLLQRGFSNREIGERLFIGMQTVKTHAHVVYRKLGVAGRRGLIRELQSDY